MAKERDKAKLQKELFLKHLEEMPVISVVCKKTNIPKANIYRWKKEDPDFKARMDEAQIKGDDNICDLAEYQLFTKIKEGNLSAAKYYLDKRHPAYVKKPYTDQAREKTNPFQIVISTIKNKRKKITEQKRES